MASDPQDHHEVEIEEVHRDVTSTGVRLRATEWSSALVDPTSDPIVALPGVLAPRYSFAPLARSLAHRFRFIGVDFPGFGESEKPSPNRYPYGVAAFAESIADLFGGLGLGRANVLAHGVGGSVALHLAAHHAELVKRLALVAPLAQPPRQQSPYKALLGPVIGGLLAQQLLGRSWFSRIYRERVNPDVAPTQLTAYYDSLNPPATRAALLATLRASLDGRSVIADSRRVRSPTLLLWGREDRLLPVEHGRYLSREMPQAGLELLNTGHACHEQSPSSTAQILERFFSGQRAGVK